MDNFKCYAIIDKDTGEFVRCSYKYPIPFYRRYEEAKNALRGYKGHRYSYLSHSEKGHQIVEINIDSRNIKVLEEIEDGFSSKDTK